MRCDFASGHVKYSDLAHALVKLITCLAGVPEVGRRPAACRPCTGPAGTLHIRIAPIVRPRSKTNWTAAIGQVVPA